MNPWTKDSNNFTWKRPNNKKSKILGSIKTKSTNSANKPWSKNTRTTSLEVEPSLTQLWGKPKDTVISTLQVEIIWRMWMRFGLVFFWKKNQRMSTVKCPSLMRSQKIKKIKKQKNKSTTHWKRKKSWKKSRWTCFCVSSTKTAGNFHHITGFLTVSVTSKSSIRSLPFCSTLGSDLNTVPSSKCIITWKSILMSEGSADTWSSSWKRLKAMKCLKTKMWIGLLNNFIDLQTSKERNRSNTIWHTWLISLSSQFFGSFTFYLELFQDTIWELWFQKLRKVTIRERTTKNKARNCWKTISKHWTKK